MLKIVGIMFWWPLTLWLTLLVVSYAILRGDAKFDVHEQRIVPIAEWLYKYDRFMVIGNRFFDVD